MYRFVLLLLLFSSPLMGQEVFKEYLYSPDLIFKYREQIKLTDDQEKKIKETYNNSVLAYNEFKWDLDAKMVALAEIMNNPRVEVQEAKAKLEEVLAIENEIKRQRLETMLIIKNSLTPEQQEFLDGHKEESTKGYEIISSVNEDPRVVVKVSGKTDNATPLYILRDGSKETVVKDLSNFDPDMIGSIQVLKGLAAFDMYGEKGKNGVIIITLK